MYILIFFLTIIVVYILSILPRFSKREELKQFIGCKFAHRGYHCQDLGIPENSVPAFCAAIAKGYGIELDLHLTKDGKLVVFHDHTLNRLCGKRGIIEKKTYQELQQFTLYDTQERIPLFSDVLRIVDGKVPLLIELKISKNAFRISRETYRILKTYPGPYMVQSFHTLGLLWYRLYAPEILRGQLSSRLAEQKGTEPWILREAVQTLLTNIIGRPDFISYKLSDLPQFSVTLLKKIFHTPVAVWTLRTREALEKGIADYSIQIFENETFCYEFVKEP